MSTIIACQSPYVLALTITILFLFFFFRGGFLLVKIINIYVLVISPMTSTYFNIFLTPYPWSDEDRRGDISGALSGRDGLGVSWVLREFVSSFSGYGSVNCSLDI